MSKKAVGFIIIGFLVLIAVITNPEKDDHISKIGDFVSTEVGLLGGANFSVEQNVNVIFYSVLSDLFLNRLLNSNTKYENWVILSITKTRYRGKEHLLGIGVFGNIYIPSAKYFKEELKVVYSEYQTSVFNPSVEFESSTLPDLQAAKQHKKIKDLVKKYGKK